MARIILDCDLMRYRNSGLYQYCLNIGNYVDEIIRRKSTGDTLRYYIPGNERNAFYSTGQCIAEKRHHKYFKPFLLDCDIWHAPFQSGRIFPKNNKKIKVVLTIHDLNSLHEGKPREEQLKSLSHTQQLINRADAIVCISDFCKKDVLSHCDVKNKPVHVIHNGTHKLVEPELHTSSYMPPGRFLFGMGYVNRKKNFHVLLPLLLNSHFQLIIAGNLDDPDYVRFIRQQANQLGVGERLHILGPVSESEKSWYLKHCEAFMHPSLAEGFGAPVVEAMSFGKPIFLSNLTSLPEIAADVAFYFDNFEPGHMRHVFSSGMQEYQRNGLSNKIIQRGMQFDWRKSAEAYLGVYHSLL